MKSYEWEKFFRHLTEEAHTKYGSEVKRWMVETLYNWKVLNEFYEDETD